MGVIRPLALAGVLAAAFAAPALAAPTWSASTSLSTPGAVSEYQPSVAIVDGGFGIETWAEPASGHSVVRVALHAPAGAWTPTPLAAGPSIALPGDGCNPYGSIDPAGNALVVWAQFVGPGCGAGMQTILFSSKVAGSATWGAPQVLGESTTPGDWQPIASSNSAGQMVVAWGTADGTNKFEFGAVGTPTTGFEPAAKLVTAPTADQLYYPAVAIGPNGDAAVQWQHNTGSYGNIQIALRPRGGTFQTIPTPLTTLANPDGASIGSVAIDGAGDVLSGYSVFNGTSSISSFATRFRPAANQVWQPEQPLITPLAPFKPSWLTVGLDGNGTGTAVWSEANSVGSDPHPRRLWSATRPAGAASPWSNPSALSEVVAADYSLPLLKVAPSGAAVVSWQVTTPTDAAQALYRPAGGVFGPLTSIGDGSGASVSLAPSGDAALAFYGSAKDARVSVLDMTAPSITVATVPASATVGQAVPMSTVAVDAWSSLAAGQPAWNFGDGAGAAGASVAHTYAAPGTYTVTIGASDALGFAAPAVTRQITIAAAAVPPPPSRPTTSVAKPKTSLRYVASKLVGRVSLSGSSSAKAVLTVTIRKHGAKKTSLSSTFTANGGTWTRMIRLPSGLTPGKYDVLVSGATVTSSSTSFSIASPAAGIVKRAYASGPRRGPAVTRLGHSSELWAHFSFGTLPKKGRRITTQWILPSGSKLAANTRPRTSLVEAQVKDLSGKPLPSGRWRCVIRAGKTVVATLNVRLR